MNIFYTNSDPKICAQEHVDKHCVKMILEYAQLLSTAHRVIDGVQSVGLSKTGRKQTRYVLSDDREYSLYSATHLNHPSAIWARASLANYNWLFQLFEELLAEYTYRYGKIHATQRLLEVLRQPPTGIANKPFTEPTPAMPDTYKVPGDSKKSYHNYINVDKQRMFSWKKREKPEWIVL